MSNFVKYVPKADVFVAYMEGKITFEDIALQTLQIQKDPQYHDRVDIIRDFRDIDITVDQGAFEKMLKTTPSESMSSGRAALLVSKAVETAFAFLYQQKTNQRLEVFTTVESACNWLQKPSLPILQILTKSE